MYYKIDPETIKFLEELLLNVDATHYDSMIPKGIPRTLPLAYFGNMTTICVTEYKTKRSKDLVKVIDFIGNVNKAQYSPVVLADFTAELLEKINDHIGLNDPKINAHLTEEMKKTILTV